MHEGGIGIKVNVFRDIGIIFIRGGGHDLNGFALKFGFFDCFGGPGAGIHIVS